jgi:uncharacterized membrane protein YhhN
MKQPLWIVFFFIALGGNIAGIQLEQPLLVYIFKPLIILALIGFFIQGTSLGSEGLKKWIVTALFFSWLGDVLLMFENRNSIFFLFGLSAFLVAHIFYIVFFHSVRMQEKVASRWWLLLIVVAYYAALIALLSPYLGDMKLPVRIYGIVISFMFLLALHMSFIRNKPAGRKMMTGALLFVVSDSVLAINKFYQPFVAAGVIIMLTYGLAQLLIVLGAIKYIRD